MDAIEQSGQQCSNATGITAAEQQHSRLACIHTSYASEWIHYAFPNVNPKRPAGWTTATQIYIYVHKYTNRQTRSSHMHFGTAVLRALFRLCCFAIALRLSMPLNPVSWQCQAGCCNAGWHTDGPQSSLCRRRGNITHDTRCIGEEYCCCCDRTKRIGSVASCITALPTHKTHTTAKSIGYNVRMRERVSLVYGIYKYSAYVREVFSHERCKQCQTDHTMSTDPKPIQFIYSPPNREHHIRHSRDSRNCATTCKYHTCIYNR